MKKYILAAFLAAGILSTTTSFAQVDPKAEKKERRENVKDSKAIKKEDNGSERKSARKHQKAVKKADRSDIKEEKGK